MHSQLVYQVHTVSRPPLGPHALRSTRCRRGWPAHATPNENSEFEGVEGNEVLQEALMQQLRVQIETQTLKDEIKEDLKGKVEEMKQLGEEVRERMQGAAPLSNLSAIQGLPHSITCSFLARNSPSCFHAFPSYDFRAVLMPVSMCVHALQLISQLDAELGIEKFRAELESTQVLVSL